MKSKFIILIGIIIIISEIIVISFLPQIRWTIWRAQNWSDTNTSWVRTWSGSDSTWGRQMAIDGEDNIYVFASGNSDDYLLKYTDKGDLMWTKKIDVDNFEGLSLHFLALNSQGDIYLGGTIDQFRLYIQEPDNNVILIKFNKSGEQQWIKTYSGQDLSDMQIDSSDNLYLLTKIVNGSISSNFLVKIENSGAIIWNKTIWDEPINIENYGERNSLLINGESDIYVGGFFNEDFALFKCNSSGILQRNITLSKKDYSHYFSMAFDNSNNIIFYDSFHLFKLNSTMTMLWSVNTSFYSYADSKVIVNAENEILITTSKTIPCISNSFLFKPMCTCTSINLETYTASGTLISSKCCTGCSFASSESIALDSQNNIYILGTLYGKWSCNDLPYELLLLKNPRNTSSNCIEIYQDLLLLLIVLPSIIGTIFIYIRNKRTWDRNAS